MNRRALILFLCNGAIVWPNRVGSQQPPMARVGWLTSVANPQIDSFRAGMRDLGYIDGRNLTIEQRDSGDRPERLANLATDLVRRNVDVIVAVGIVAARAAREATKTTPIIFVTNDPVGRGLVESLARPGGNLTGLELMATDINGKWLELISELLPGASRFAAVVDPEANPDQGRLLAIEAALRGIELTVGTEADLDGLAAMFEKAARSGARGMIVTSSARFHGKRGQIVGLAAQYRLPTIYEHRDFAIAGGLMSYGPDINSVFRRMAYYIDRILKGTRPANLPVEQPTNFELVINLKTARSLGLAIPPTLLAHADELIE